MRSCCITSAAACRMPPTAPLNCCSSTKSPSRMSRKSKPHDNATVESCVKTLRQEELYCSEYRASADAALRSGAFSSRCTTRSAGIQRWATARRRSSSKRCCHSPLPAAREKKCCEAWDNLSSRQCRLSDAGRKAIELYAPPYRLDEFPVGCSLAGCAPAEPVPASPTGSSSARKGRRRLSKTQRTANCV